MLCRCGCDNILNEHIIQVSISFATYNVIMKCYIHPGLTQLSYQAYFLVSEEVGIEYLLRKKNITHPQYAKLVQ